MATEHQVDTILFRSIEQLNEQLPESRRLKATRETRLFGESGELDSLGLVRLIVAIEQRVLEEMGVKVTLADEKAMSQHNSPFLSVGSLSDYVFSLVSN